MRRPRPASIRRAVSLAAVFPLLAALGGCGPGRDEFAPACPVARPLPAAEHLLRYRNPTSPGGRDPAELEVSGLLLGVDGKCRPGDTANTLTASMTLRMQLEPGPAAPAGGVDVPYFVAVAQGERILTKRVFYTHVDVPAGHAPVVLTSDPIAVKLPLGPKQTGADYTIWVGFQLTQAEFTAPGAP